MGGVVDPNGSCGYRIVPGQLAFCEGKRVAEASVFLDGPDKDNMSGSMSHEDYEKRSVCLITLRAE